MQDMERKSRNKRNKSSNAGFSFKFVRDFRLGGLAVICYPPRFRLRVVTSADSSSVVERGAGSRE